ncbi:MAG: hypothetical protein Q8Q25_00605 [bacterium]|nr:hypothetical protein [bacterium]
MIKEVSKSRLLAALGLVILGSFFAFDWRNKQILIDAAYQDLTLVHTNLHELVDLGFDVQDEAMQLLQKRIQRSQDMIAQLKRDWFVLSKVPCVAKDLLDRRIDVYKKMMRSCVRDIHDYTKLGYQKNGAFQFAYDNLVHLEIALENLKRCREVVDLKEHDTYHYVQEMQHMIGINQHMVDHYKKLLQNVRSNAITLDDNQVTFIKKNIAQHLQIIDELQDLIS